MVFPQVWTAAYQFSTMVKHRSVSSPARMLPFSKSLGNQILFDQGFFFHTVGDPLE